MLCAVKGSCYAKISKNPTRGLKSDPEGGVTRFAKLLSRNFGAPVQGGTLPPHVPWEIRVQLPDGNDPVPSTSKGVSMRSPSSHVLTTNRVATIRVSFHPWHRQRGYTTA